MTTLEVREGDLLILGAIGGGEAMKATTKALRTTLGLPGLDILYIEAATYAPVILRRAAQ